MLIEKAKIINMLPHGNTMCLLDGVLNYDENTITCISHHWQQSNNPLLNNHETMGVSILAEYGAQAAGIHSAIQQKAAGDIKAAYVGAIKQFKFYTSTITKKSTYLKIQASCHLTNERSASYDFSVSDENNILAQGRLLLALPE